MKRTVTVLAASTLVLISPLSVRADDESPTTTTAAPATTEAPTTTAAPATTDAPTTTSASTTTETPATTTAPASTSPTTTAAGDPCRVDGYACGWAMLDENNNVVNVIVCTVEVCGGGTWDGRRVVLQTRQMPGGNVAGYNGGTYNDATNTFTVNGGYTLVGGSEVGDLTPPSTTTTVPEVTPTTIEVTTTTSDPLVASAVFGIDRTIPRVSTTTVTTKRKVVATNTQTKKVVVKKKVARK